jgi:hypothetical protein
VLGDLHVGLHGRNGMAAGLQIEGEALQDYAKMAGGHPTSNEGAKE